MGSQASRRPAPAPSQRIRQEVTAVLDGLRRIVQALRVGDSAAERTARLGVAQLYALAQLADAPAESMADLAARTFTDPSSISVVVAKLLARGLVRRKRSTADARRFGVVITAKGIAALQRAPSPPQERLASALVGMPVRSRRALQLGLEQLVSAMHLTQTRAPLFFTEAPSRRSSRGRT